VPDDVHIVLKLDRAARLERDRRRRGGVGRSNDFARRGRLWRGFLVSRCRVPRGDGADGAHPRAVPPEGWCSAPFEPSGPVFKANFALVRASRAALSPPPFA
jgi:hypothetical protein